MESLKECPNCGGGAYIETRYNKFAGKENLFTATVKCTKCNFGRGVMTYDPVEAIEQAIFEWNSFAGVMKIAKEGAKMDKE